MGLKVDMSGAGREPLPEGNYTLRINEITVETSKKKPDGSGGKPYLKFKYVVVEPTEWAGRFVWDNVSLSENALWRAQQVLETITGEPWRDDEMEIEPNDLVGIVCKAIIYQDEYENKINNKIKEILPHNDGDSFVDGDEDEPF